MNNKRNNRYKSRGSILVITALAAIVWIFIAQSLFIVGAGGFGMIKSSRVALQAQQYAEIEVDRLKNVAYENLDSDGAHSRQAIANIQESGWEDEVSIGSEHAISGSDDAKQRIATINVYKSGDTLPRFTLEVPLSSQSSNSDNEQSALSEGGWKRFSDGLTIEWGSASGTGKHVFPRAFTKVFSVTITKNNDNSGSAPGVDTIITGTDNTGFYTRIQKMWDTQYNGASLSDDWHNVYYIAVGIS